MKNLYDVLRNKEQEILRVSKEVEALRIAARLLADDAAAEGKHSRILEMPEDSGNEAASGA